MPVITFDSMEQVPEGLKEAFKLDETTGKYAGNVVASARLDEFREKNINLSRQVEQMAPILARVKDIAGDDLDSFANDLTGLRDIAKRVQDGELKTNDQIEQAVQDRIKSVKDGYEENSAALRRQVKDAEQKALTFEQRLNQTHIRGEVTTSVIHPNSGIRAEALPDILERAYKLFKIEDGKLVPKQGEATLYGADGTTPMTPTEWLVKLRDEAPHYFKGNFGGGASGGKDGEKFHGMSKAEYDKLPAIKKLALANAAK